MVVNFLYYGIPAEYYCSAGHLVTLISLGQGRCNINNSEVTKLSRVMGTAFALLKMYSSFVNMIKSNVSYTFIFQVAYDVRFPQ